MGPMRQNPVHTQTVYAHRHTQYCSDTDQPWTTAIQLHMYSKTRHPDTVRNYAAILNKNYQLVHNYKTELFGHETWPNVEAHSLY